ncbi:uncharacterized protein LOC126324052 [Schistocerca gregaria]|uniref:uncharacterized protein LOC126324052 n=1 Tax=Schistocerca gregaria TaxID=7010 RepID=UPI00211E9B55|nr:uncharacterized protein LOC126324052 [Schistocerca gregaria]
MSSMGDANLLELNPSVKEMDATERESVLSKVALIKAIYIAKENIEKYEQKLEQLTQVVNELPDESDDIYAAPPPPPSITPFLQKYKMVDASENRRIQVQDFNIAKREAKNTIEDLMLQIAALKSILHTTLLPRIPELEAIIRNSDVKL